MELLILSRLILGKERNLDDYISEFQALTLLTQGQLTEEEAEQVWRKVLEETDIDDDKKLSSNEFSHVINKSPDFLTTFNIRI